LIVADGHLQFDFGQKVHHVLCTAIKLGVPLLTAEPLDLRDREALHADFRQGLADIVKLEGLDNGGNEFHSSPPVVANTGRSPGDSDNA
jgi:hypothetical protein